MWRVDDKVPEICPLAFAHQGNPGVDDGFGVRGDMEMASAFSPRSLDPMMTQPRRGHLNGTLSGAVR